MKKCCLLLLILCIRFIAIAQSLVYTHYTVADKLPSNICYRILQDEKGFIWVATEKGIALFDGYGFKPIHTKNKLSNLDIWGLFKDDENRIWLKSKQNKSLFIYKDSVYDINRHQTKEEEYTALINYGTSLLIFKQKENDNCIYILNKKQELVGTEIPPVLKQKILVANKNSHLVHFEQSNNSLLLLFQSGEMLLFDFISKQTKTRIFKTPINLLLNTKCVTDNIPNEFYFSANDSIFCINKGQTRYINTLQKSNTGPNAVMIGISHHTFFCRYNQKIIAIDSAFQQIPFTLPSLQASISQIFEDNEHNLWFVTIGNGIYFVSNKTLENKIFQKENGLLDNHILSLCQDKNKNLFMGYYSQEGFQYLSNKTITTIPKSAGIASSMILFESGDILVSDEYISRKPLQIKYFNKGFKETLLKKQHFFISRLNLGIKSVYKLNDHSFLAGSMSTLVKISKINNVLIVDSITKTPANIYSIATIDDKILIGTPDGLYSFENQKLHYIDHLHNVLQGNIRSIMVDELQHIWVASDNGNLICYSKNLYPIVHFPQISGLVTSLYLDTIDHVMMASSSNGIYTIQTKKPYNYTYYTSADGLPSNEVNATVADKDHIYAATSFGLGILKKKSTSYFYTPKIYCTRMFVNNIEKTISENETLDYHQNNIRIELAALSYQSLGDIKYYYRLQSKYKVWTVTNQPQIEFASLNPGNYELEIFAKDVNQLQTVNRIRINFSIAPPFWKTTWFYGLITLLFFVAFFMGLYMWFQRGKRKALHALNVKKEFAELKLVALQSQLNSHFIYNSLNAIQNFILNNNVVTASEYMNKFAKLIRLFLESSRSQQAPLQKEIELITNYTSLEKLRFDDKFEVIISAQNILDKQIPFPTSMVQPFVENAIIHGLLHKQTKGLLRISFSETKQEILCVIEDDGIGRANSLEINKSRKRKSLGMDIIQDKIINIENLHEKKISIEIIDKNVETHSSTGTIVNIHYKK